MKTLACFVVTWITAALLLLLLGQHYQQHLQLGGAEIFVQDQGHFSANLWHSLWVSALYSAVNTFIVRFWQMQIELKQPRASGV